MKRFFVFLLVCTLILGASIGLSGCGPKAPEPEEATQPAPSATTVNIPLDVVIPENLGVLYIDEAKLNDMLEKHRFSENLGGVSDEDIAEMTWPEVKTLFLSTIHYIGEDGKEYVDPLALQSWLSLTFMTDKGFPLVNWHDLIDADSDENLILSEYGMDLYKEALEILQQPNVWVATGFVPEYWSNHGSAFDGIMYSGGRGISNDDQGRLAFYLYEAEPSLDNPNVPSVIKTIEEVGEALLGRCFNKAKKGDSSHPPGKTDEDPPEENDPKDSSKGSGHQNPGDPSNPESGTRDEAGRNDTGGPGQKEETPTTPAPTPHSHSFGGWVVTKAAGPGVAGWQVHTCSCGFSEGQAIPALPIVHTHNYDIYIVDVAAQPGVAGSGHWGCSCGAGGGGFSIPALPLPQPDVATDDDSGTISVQD